MAFKCLQPQDTLTFNHTVKSSSTLTFSFYKVPTTLKETTSKQSTHWNPSPTSAYYLLSLNIITSPNLSTSHYTIKLLCQPSHSFSSKTYYRNLTIVKKWKIKEEMLVMMRKAQQWLASLWLSLLCFLRLLLTDAGGSIIPHHLCYLHLSSGHIPPLYAYR